MAYYGSNYPSNSGPPPPPMGGAYGGYGAYGGGGAAYPGYGGMQQSYGQPNPYGQSAYANSAAVPGFTAPPQGIAPPMSRQFAFAQQSMQPYGCQMNSATAAMAHRNPHDAQFQQMQQMQQQLFEQARMLQQQQYGQQQQNDNAEQEAKLKKLQEDYEKLQLEAQQKAAAKMEEDENFKQEMRANFVAELMRRQEVSGTFEDCTGFVNHCTKFLASDPIAQWFSEKRYNIIDEDYDPQPDVEFLRDGFRGLGTDEDKIIQLVVNRSNAQRNRMRVEYKTAYGEDLVEDLRGETSGNFRNLLIGLFESPARYDAYCMKKAIYGLGTDEATLIEILMTRTNAQIAEMKDEYNNITYEKLGSKGRQSLEEDIKGDTSGDFKKLLISAAQGNRKSVKSGQLNKAVEDQMVNGKFTGMFQVNYKKLVNEEKVKAEANALKAAGEDRWGTDEETFTRVFGVSDFFTLREIYDEYVRLTQRDIINSINRETSGDYEKGLLAIAQSVKCRPMFFAQKLYHSMKGLGTDDNTLIRIIVSRAEIDLVQIKKCFLETYKQTLWNFIKDDTSGDYKKLLLHLVGKN